MEIILKKSYKHTHHDSINHLLKLILSGHIGTGAYLDRLPDYYGTHRHTTMQRHSKLMEMQMFNMQTPYRRSLAQESNPGLSCCRATVFQNLPPCSSCERYIRSINAFPVINNALNTQL